jgi:hypothetical protein
MAQTAQSAPPDFSRDIRPLLSDRCYKCHGPGKSKGDLQLDTRETALAVLSPDDLAKSEFLRRIMTDDEDDRMPPVGKAKPLTAQEKSKLRAWVEAGAPYQEHWAYVKPLKAPTPPKVNAVDHFIRARLAEEGLPPSPPAETAVLLRRLSLDLIGLPPTEAELDAFLADPSPAAYGREVERLLGSPHFGEKWARHWLDLARYADSDGYQHDGLRTMWPYRDWVIRAFNADMPFDRFTIEQLGGDLLPNPTTDQLVATAFHRNTSANLAGCSSPEEVRVQMKLDRVATTGLTWLGATLECAACHDHKFDPVTQRDFYKLYAYFDRTPPELSGNGLSGGKEWIAPEIEVPGSPTEQEIVADLLAKRKELMQQLESVKSIALADRDAWEERFKTGGGTKRIPWEKLPAYVRKARGLDLIGQPVTLRTADSDQKVLYVLFYDHPATAPFAKPLAKVDYELEKVRPPRVMVMRDLPQWPDTHIFQRGNYLSPGEPVAPGVIDALHPLPADAPRNRLGLAQWLVSRDNPLTARVTVNRWWAEIFGTGIVSTVEDFGMQSETPSHRELLDSLAVELMENGWSMKHVLKLIVMSETYRQSSRATSAALAKDPANRLLSHASRFRLPAELVRDNALAISGQLSLKMFGRPIYPPQPPRLWEEIVSVELPEYPVSTGEELYRRGIYVVLRRGNANPTLLNFDATDRALCVTKRSRTNTPLQALTLMNDPVFVEAARHFAGEIDSWPGDPAAKAARAFRRAVSRMPNATELEVLLKLQAASGSWFDAAQALLNFDEAVTKS